MVLEKLARKLASKHLQEDSTSLNAEESSNPAFEELTAYVRLNFTEKFTLDQLGKRFGLAPGYICNLFSKNLNTTLTCFVTKLRMDHAVMLISDNALSLKSIALTCGYKDYFYFNKVFKSYFGVAPSQYLSSKTPLAGTECTHSPAVHLESL